MERHNWWTHKHIFLTLAGAGVGVSPKTPPGLEVLYQRHRPPVENDSYLKNKPFYLVWMHYPPKFSQGVLPEYYARTHRATRVYVPPKSAFLGLIYLEPIGA
jgi:hypothetical protein